MPDEVPPQARRRGLGLTLALGGAAAIAIVAVGVTGRARSERRLGDWTAAQAVPSVSVIKPTMTKADGNLVLPATVQALNSAPIFARTNGYVRRWLVDIGDTVRVGQTLAVLDAPEVDQQVLAAKADLQTALANRGLAATTATRWSTMLAKDAVSKQETDEKIGDLAAKNAVVNAARANVSRLRYLQGFTRLAAPFSGVVTSRATDVGALVTAGSAGSTPLFTISDVDRMRIFVRVPQAYSADVRHGMPVTLTLPEYPGRTFQSVLTRTAGAVDPSSGTVLVELQADNADRALKPGAYGQASFPLAGRSGGLTIPASALIVGQAGTQVAVLAEGRVARLKTVQIGRDMGATVQVSSGIAATDRIIDTPPDALRSGDRVSVGGQGDAHGSR